MKKIMALLLAILMLFAFVACDNGNGSSGSGSSGLIDEATLTVPVTSAEDFNFIGTWDFQGKVTNSEQEGITQQEFAESVVTVTETKVTQYYTKLQVIFICDTDELYNSLEQNIISGGMTVSFDEENKTITMNASEDYLANMTTNFPEQTYDEFVAGLESLLSSGATATTNSSKTALKVVESDENETMTQILVKR